MEIPQTKTLLDSQQEHKNLREEIALLRQDRDAVARDLKLYEEAREAVKKEMGSEVFLSQVRDGALATSRENMRRDINELKGIKADYENSVGRLGSQKATLQKELMDIKADIESEKGNLEDIRKQRESDTAVLNVTKADLEKAKEGLVAEITTLQKDRDAAKTQLETYMTEYSIKHTDILQGEIRLSTKASDLKIYEGRLRKKWDEVNPGIEMILPE